MTSRTTADAMESTIESPVRIFGHPLADLLELSAGRILDYYKKSQAREFMGALQRVRAGGGDLASEVPLLGAYLSRVTASTVRARLSIGVLEELFLRMHDHVMAHPVWTHPFFARVAAGKLSSIQLRCFARHYFNQVKNTRQCVAAALGRFHAMIEQPDGVLNVVLSELTQLVLSGLLADEYGFAGEHVPRSQCAAPAGAMVDIQGLFSRTTHPELFRRFQAALGDTASEFDVPMLHGVADNVLVQMLLAANRAYDRLEALASVGLGMEWGVPAFFSMIMAGIIKVGRREGLTFDAGSMEIWSAHVRQDVEHAIAVMVATSFYVHDESDVSRIKNATNVLMAFRYNMMSDIYREVFSEPCADIGSVELETRHLLHDHRIESLLAAERTRIHEESVRDREQYLRRRVALPYAKGDRK